MLAPEEPVAITGVGMVTPFGIGCEAFWEGVLQSRSACRKLEHVVLQDQTIDFGCCVDDATLEVAAHVKNRKSIKLMSRAMQFAAVASDLAYREAGLTASEVDPGRAAVVLGAGGVGLHDIDYMLTYTHVLQELGAGEVRGPRLDELALRHMNPLTPLKMMPNMAAAHVAIEHGFRGENLTICTACTSGTQALGEAMRMVRDGRADVVLAGGTDAMVNIMGLVGFGMLGVLSKRREDPARASRPFERDRDGFVLGEGSAMMVLESRQHARRRGARILAEIHGYGCCADAYRVTDEREDGSGCCDAMRRALTDARTTPEAVQYVNAHGTGTRMNDRTEALALKQVFGEHVRNLLVSSTKSQVGHLVAAAGAVEAAACVLALRHQVVPPTINYEHPDPECDLDVVPNEPRQARLDLVMSNSFGFGGQNACLVLGRAACA